MIDFVSSILSGVTANGVTRLLEALWGRQRTYELQQEKQDSNPDEPPPSDPEQQERSFKSFHIKTGFEPVINSVLEPIVHLIVEDQPTTAWHLVVIVVESRVTGEWYVSQKGEMAFEGSGGGLYVAGRVVELCRNRKLPTAAWVLPRSKSDELTQGTLLWSAAKQHLIPLLAYSRSEYFVKHIAKQYRELGA